MTKSLVDQKARRRNPGRRCYDGGMVTTRHGCAALALICGCAWACGDTEGETAHGSGGASGSAGTSSSGGSSAGSSSSGGSAGSGGLGAGCDSGPFDEAALDALDEYCAMYDANVAACGYGDEEPCPVASCLERLYDRAYFPLFVQCQVARSCEEFLGSDDHCFAQATGELTPDRQAWLDACQSRVSECNVGVSDDLCAAVSPLIHRRLFCAIDACLDGPCEDLKACVDRIDIPRCW